MQHATIRQAVLGTALALATALPAAADSKIEKNLKLEPGGKLTVVSDVGSVEVTGTSSSGARVVLTSKDDDLASKFDMSFEEQPVARVATARAAPKANWTLFVIVSSSSCPVRPRSDPSMRSWHRVR